MSINIAGGDLQWDAGIDLTGFRSQLAEIRNGLNSLAVNQKNQANDIENFAKKAATAAAGYFSIQAAANFVQSMVKVRGEFQQIEVAYRTMLGSKEKADQLMAESVRLAAITPFTLQDVASGSKQLLAYGFAAKDITGNLEMLGNIASGVGSQLGDLTYLYGTLKASGRVTQIDINQFAGRGIPVYQALADTMKITTAQVREYVSAGKIGFPEIEKAFNSLTGAGGQFYNLMQEQSKTLTGQLSNLEDAWSRMLNDLGTQNEGIFASAIGGAITLVDNYQNVIDIIGALVAGYGAYRAALLISAAASSIATYATTGFTAAEILQYYWTTTLTKAQKILNLTMLANPYVAVAAALAALGTYLYLASENTLKLKTASELTADAVSQQGDAVETTEAKLKVYVEMLKNSNLSEVERLNIYNKIKSIDPSIVKGIDAKTISYINLKSSVDAYILSLRQKFSAEANEGAIKASIENENALKKQLEGVGNEGFKLSFGRLLGDKDIEDAENLKKSNAIKATLLQQQIVTNKLIGGAIQTGSKDQIKAAENDLKIIEQEKKRYAKGTIELATLQQQAIEKQDEINSLRKLKQKNDDSKNEVKVIRNISVIDKEIKDKKGEQEVAVTDKQSSAKTKYAILQSEINKLEKEKIAITGESAKVSAKYAKTEEDLAKKKLDILNEINQASTDFNAKNRSSNAKEIEDNKKKYAELRKKATDYNKEAFKAGKETIGGKDLAMINNIEAKELYAIKYKQDTEALKSKLEVDRKLIEDFEQYKLTFGEQKAREKYGYEVKSNAELLAKLKADNAKLAVMAIFGGGLTSGESDRLTQGGKDASDLQAIENKRFSDAYNSALTYNQKIERINEEFRQKARNLGASITDEQKLNLLNQRDDAVNTVKDTALQQSKVYKDLATETFNTTREKALEQAKVLRELIASGQITGDAKSEIEKQLGNLEIVLKIGADQANLDSLKEKLAGFTALLNGDVKDNEGSPIILTSEQSKGIIANIQKIKGEIAGIDTNGDGNVNYGDKLAKQFEYLKGDASTVLNGVSKDLGRVSSSFNELSNAFGGVNTEAGYALDTIGSIVGVASDAAGAAASFASGDIIGGITGTIKAITGVLSIGKKVKEMNAAARKEVADFYAQAITGEREYQELLAKRALQNIRDNKSVLRGIRDEIALRKTQLSSYAQETAEIMAKLQGQSSIASETYKHGTWFRKASITKTYSSLAGKSFAQLTQLLAQGKLEGDAKALVERLKEIEEKGYDAEQAMADLAKETSELFTGTSADNLTNSLLDMFKSGKTGAQDLADFFKATMDDAALSIFKNKVLSDLMIKFYDEFDKAAQSDESLTEGEIADLQKLFVSLTDDAQKKFNDLKKITGSDLSGPSSQGELSKGISGITETTANRLEAEFGGLRLANLETNSILKPMGMTLMQQLQISQLNLNSIIKIEQNTLRTADNTDRLSGIETALISMDKKIISGDALKRGAGI